MRSLLTNQNRTEAEKPVSSAVRQRQSLMFRARSYMAFAITPQAPIVEWLAELDTSLERSESFFSGHPVALDLSTVSLSAAAIMHLVENLAERKIRVLGITGVDPAIEQPGLPPILRGGRGPQQTTPDLPKAPTLVVEAAPLPRQQPASLLIETPVRSGQSVVFVDGDVTVLGSVGSGAEIVAGGSVHIYGTLRGRAMAGANGNSRARIFCQRVEAELLAIDSYYKTADDIEESLRRRPIQAWLEGETLKISALN
jgi:septum site-determining protein MinC